MDVSSVACMKTNSVMFVWETLTLLEFSVFDAPSCKKEKVHELWSLLVVNVISSLSGIRE